ncbi:MAG: hypothetical protein U5K31_02740 [Balneolaceae bacterium]|nr:hypothetical protein [Balneolaceae bacterium]
MKLPKNTGRMFGNFTYEGGYPKKRQWAIDTLEIHTPWVLLLDADEVVPKSLMTEIKEAVEGPNPADAYFIRKGFHFMGRKFRYGGFSFDNILLFRKGKAMFERLLDNSPDNLDMEVRERLIVKGKIGRLHSALIHADQKDLQAYLDRHNQYSTWEAHLRHEFFKQDRYGEQSIKPTPFGNAQQRRRFLKKCIIRLPFEHFFWFIYHYILRLGILEGIPGYYALKIRSNYISEVNAKLYELRRDVL